MSSRTHAVQLTAKGCLLVWLVVTGLSACGPSGTTCADYLRLDTPAKVAAIEAADPDTYKSFGTAKDTFAGAMVPKFDEFCSNPENADWDIADTAPSLR